MLGHDSAQHAAKRPRLAQLGKGTVRSVRPQGPPDWLAPFDIARLAQGHDGASVDSPGLHQVIEEPIDNTGAVQPRRRRPMVGRCPQPSHQHVRAEFGVALGDVLEAMKRLLVIDAAVRAAQAKARHISCDQQPFGIGPCRHDSTPDPGTSSAMARRSSVASLR